MNTNIKMVGLDLDGTLLTTEKKLSAYTRNVLEQAIAQGCVVLISTGRPISAVPKEILEIRGMKYAVTVNGAKILNLETGEAICEKLLPPDVALQSLRIYSEYDSILELIIDGNVYAKAECFTHLEDYYDDQNVIDYVLNTRIPVDDVVAMISGNEQPVDKIRAIFRNPKEREEAKRRLETIPGIVITSSCPIDLEVNIEGANKGLGLIWLGQQLGIKREEIMACGDSFNDYEMLKEVGFAVAMGNAEQDLKEIADYVTDTNDEDGVAKAIERFVLK